MGFINFILIFADPEVIGTLVLEKNFTNEVVRLDWSSTFRLNGMLQHYDLSRNGILLRRNPMTSISLPREPTGIGKLGHVQ